MPLRLHHIVVDAHDLPGLARFWTQALGWKVLSEREHEIVIGTDENAPVGMCFMPVADAKTVKNRLHLDLTSGAQDREQEIGRLLALGARRVDIGQTGAESWTVLADPEGNEFCVIRPKETLIRLGPSPAARRSSLSSRRAERIFYREHAETAPVLKIFRHETFRAGPDSCLDDQCVPEGQGVLLFKSARGDNELWLRGDVAPFSVSRHDGPRFRQRHGRLEFPGYDGVELLQYLGAEGAASAIPQLS
jgi:predicted enzyme related to lactoylglutathione lyase